MNQRYLTQFASAFTGPSVTTMDPAVPPRGLSGCLHCTHPAVNNDDQEFKGTLLSPISGCQYRLRLLSPSTIRNYSVAQQCVWRLEEDLLLVLLLLAVMQARVPEQKWESTMTRIALRSPCAGFLWVDEHGEAHRIRSEWSIRHKIKRFVRSPDMLLIQLMFYAGNTI